MSNHGETINSTQTPLEEVRVALVVPHEKSVLVRPDLGSGLFVGERGELQSVEHAAHAIVRRQVGLAALSSVRALRSHGEGDAAIHGYAVRPSHIPHFNPHDFNLRMLSYKEFLDSLDNPVDEHFARELPLLKLAKPRRNLL